MDSDDDYGSSGPNDDRDSYIDDWYDLPIYLSYSTKLIACNYYSHTTGNKAPIEYITNNASVYNILVLVDGTQAIAHTPVDVVALGCDFFVFSGHKIYAPNGIGILYINDPYRINVDLGCYFSSKLSCVCLSDEDDRRVFINNLKN